MGIEMQVTNRSANATLTMNALPVGWLDVSGSGYGAKDGMQTGEERPDDKNITVNSMHIILQKLSAHFHNKNRFIYKFE